MTLFTEESEARDFLKDFNTKTLGYSIEYGGSGDSPIQDGSKNFQFNKTSNKKEGKSQAIVINSKDIRK